MRLALLISLIAFPLSAAEWLTDRDAAIARARAERKPILAYKTRTADQLLGKAEAEPAIAHAMQSFVLLRVERGSAAVAILDPDGKEIALPNMLSNLNSLASFLVAARAASEEIVNSADLRRAGKTTHADYVLGRAYMTMGLHKRAADLLLKTANKLRYDGESDLAHTAQANAAMSLYLSGQKSRARVMFEQLARSARTPQLQAEVLYFLGTIAANERDADVAKRQWRKAYEIAPAGSPVADVIRAALEGVDEKPASKDIAGPGAALRILAPARKVILGKAEFEAVPGDAPAAVRFYLDDVPVAMADAAPFRVTIDFGKTPTPRVVKAVALDGNGAAIAEALVTVNDRVDVLRVAITSPATQFAKGTVVVEADAAVPPGRTLARLELFWNGERLATFRRPPYRHTANLPDEFGYLRAVATLDDGTSGEAVRMLNVAASESVEVQGVTFSVVVADRHGNRVSGLKRSDFVVEEDGVPVQFSIREDENEPALIGLAIDVSASMRESILQAFRYAEAFIGSGANAADRAFVVAFDSSPRLIQSATSDATVLRSAVLSLRPAGGTSMFDGIAYALQQFEGTGGKRALVVISDGREVRSSASAEACLRLAQQIGIPIYAVSLSVRADSLRHLANDSGGIWIPAPKTEELPAIFAKIRDDVRGQYLITFVSPKPPVAGAWRALKVKVKEGRVRTVAGYRVR